MYQFFIDSSQIQGKQAVITGSDVNHIKNVLRMRIGEEIAVVSREDGREYHCQIREIKEESILCELLSEEEAGTELSAKLYLFQGLPKSDKMEWIIQKAVELGCFEIIPVACKRCVVKLDEKKQQTKRLRWQGISEAAAKQSKRRIIPEVHEVMRFSEALSYAEKMNLKLIPYEQAGKNDFSDGQRKEAERNHAAEGKESGMAETRRLISSVSAGEEVAIFIGPEGGFEEAEIKEAKQAGFFPITLGRRILRTETAGLTVLSWLMYFLEKE